MDFVLIFSRVWARDILDGRTDMIKYFWITRERDGRKIIAYNVTDGIWTSRDFVTLGEAKQAMHRALWGEF